MNRTFEQDSPEQEPSGFSAMKAEYDIAVTPKESIEDAIAAFNDINNYGIYVSNIRNTGVNKAEINKAIEDYFGPNIPAKRKSIEKQTGKTFPIKTKQAIDDFIKSFNSKPNLLKFVVKDDMLIFPQKNNPTKDVTKKIIKTVLNNAGIDYTVKEKETIMESKDIKSLKEELISKIYKKLI